MSAQARLARAALRIGRIFGAGGASWTRTRMVGDGRSGARTPSTATLTGYVVHGRIDALAPIAPPTVSVPDAPWYWLSAADQDIQAGDEIASVDDPTIAFTVPGAVGRDFGIRLGQVIPS